MIIGLCPLSFLGLWIWLLFEVLAWLRSSVFGSTHSCTTTVTRCLFVSFLSFVHRSTVRRHQSQPIKPRFDQIYFFDLRISLLFWSCAWPRSPPFTVSLRHIALDHGRRLSSTAFLPCSSCHGRLGSCLSCVIIPGTKKLKQWKPYTDLMWSRIRIVISFGKTRFFWQKFGPTSQEPRLRLVYFYCFVCFFFQSKRSIYYRSDCRVVLDCILRLGFISVSPRARLGF